MTKFQELAEKIILCRGVYTHAGKFHADDAFSCAIAALITGGNLIKIFRMNNPEDLKKAGVDDTNALIVDIGYGRFDHHQRQKEYYPDGVEKSAVAKLWEFVGEELIGALHKCPREIAHEAFVAVRERLIKPISDTDTRGQKARPNAISWMVYNRSAQAENLDEAFTDLVFDVATPILRDEIAQSVQEAQAAIEARQYASQWASEGHADWGFVPKFLAAESFEGTSVKCIIGKSARGGYNVACVDSARWPIPDSLPAPRKGHFWANFPDQKSAEEAAAWLAQFWAKEGSHGEE